MTALQQIGMNAPEANKTLVLAGIKGVFIRSRPRGASSACSSADYRQHNPQIPNRTAAIKALLKNLPADFKYEPGLVVADGDYVRPSTGAIWLGPQAY